MVQNLMQRCLESDFVCNEFFLQLVKQTTDHPGIILLIFLLQLFFYWLLCLTASVGFFSITKDSVSLINFIFFLQVENIFKYLSTKCIQFFLITKTVHYNFAEQRVKQKL